MIDPEVISNITYDINDSITESLSKGQPEVFSSFDERGEEYDCLDDLRESLKTLSKEEIEKHLGNSFEAFSKEDVYKSLVKGLKGDYPDMKEYLIHLCIFGWYRNEYLKNIPKERQNEFRDLFDTEGIKPTHSQVKGGDIEAVKVYNEEEYNELKKDDENDNADN
jgi:hypothetical protein